MTQKIGGPDGQGRATNVAASSPTARSRQVGHEHRAGEKSPQPSALRGDIQITSAARQLAALEKAIAQIPVVDEERVKAVSTALAEGSYKVDSRKVADQLLRSDTDLAAARRRDR